LKIKRNDKPTFCYVTDRRALQALGEARQETLLLDPIRRAIGAGVDWIRVRERDLEARPLLLLIQKALAASRQSSGRTRILVNDRLDVALAAGAGGVHLGETSVPAEIVLKSRLLAGRSDFLTGVSCHSLEGALDAARSGAGYIFFGPVFATPSKAAFGAPQGLALLAEVSSAVDIPVMAIGGITAENAAACLDAGASGIAGIRLFQEASDVGALIVRIHQGIQ
jgi:thiamine-phosphate pyrophosphorylase